MSHLEENARLSHELEEARDTIEGMVAQVRGLRRAFDSVMEENLELRAEVKRLRSQLDEWRKTREPVIK